MTSWLERSEAGLVDALARRLSSRAGSVFRAIGVESCRGLSGATVVALREDLSAGKHEAIRKVVLSFVQELTPKGLSFADLRFYGQSLRTLVLEALTGEPSLTESVRRQVEDWLFELILISAMRFVAQREEIVQERAMKQEVEQLEAQIGELKAAFQEKTRLLEVIRQASTPIAPVVEGILVVPLVGVFDGFRAEVLTDKLLQAVVKEEAQVVLVDIAGVPVFDKVAAELVIRLARAVRLLGTELILVGMSPTIARSIVESGVNLSGLKTLGSLQDGLAQALASRHLRIVRL